GEGPPDGALELEPRALVDRRALFVELREPLRLAVGHRQRRSRFAGAAHEPPRHPFLAQRLFDPPARVAAQDGRHPHVRAERGRRAGHVQTLSAGDLDEVDRSVDLAGAEPFDHEELVDRRVAGNADDHAAAIIPVFTLSDERRGMESMSRMPKRGRWRDTWRADPLPSVP